MKLKCWFAIFVSINYIVGQNTIENETKQAELFYEKGKNYRYKDKDSACFYFKKSMEIFADHNDWLSYLLLLKNISFTNSYHYDLQNFKKNIFSIDSLLEKRNIFFDTIPSMYGIKNNHLLSKSNYYIKIKNYKKVKEYANQLKNIIGNKPDSIRTPYDIQMLVAALEFEAGAYKMIGQNTQAEHLYQKSLRLIKKNLNEDFAYPTYRLLGDLYGRQGKYDESNTYLKNGLDREINYGVNSKNKIVKTCYAIAGNYIKMSLQDSARFYLTIANNKLSSDDSSLKSQYHEILGELEFSLGNIELSIENSNNALNFIQSDELELQRVDIARIHRLQGRFQFGIKDYEKSLKNFNTALEWLTLDLKLNDSAINFSMDRIYDKYEYLKILKEKIKTQIKLNDYTSAHQTALVAIGIIDDLRPSFQDEEDKQFLIENFYPVFESGLQAVYKLYKNSGNEKFIDQAFYLIEKSKAVILLGALLDAQAYEFSQIPHYYTEKEKQLSISLSELSQKLHDDNGNITLQDQYFETRKAYKKLVECLEIEYPDYYKLKYDTNTIDLKDFQDSLEDKTVAISYLMEEDLVYALGVTKDSKELVKISTKNVLEEQILSFKESLENHSSNPEIVKKQSVQLYNQLLDPFFKDNLFDKLIIFPSGSLNHIPFEVLNDGSKYVVENTAVNSSNSATLLQHLNQKEYKNKEMIAFAPNFFGKYISLKSSQNKTRDIVSKYEGVLFEGTNATLAAFNQHSPAYGLIHLATHAILDDKNPGRSHLVFAGNGSIDSLRISDIYVQDINASLVFLSACQTDIGQLKKGEGMISLSRAFFYAGALSLASSKWQVNDASTSEIIDDFYKYLYKGKAKDKALQLSKVDFLNRHKDEKDYLHPYWWSGITISGNMSPIKNQNINWYWLLVLILIFPVGIWHKRKKQN